MYIVLVYDVSQEDHGTKRWSKIFKTCKTGRKSVKDAGVIFYEHNRLFINTIDELLEIIELQLAGKKRMPAKSFINGFHNLEDFYIS